MDCGPILINWCPCLSGLITILNITSVHYVPRAESIQSYSGKHYKLIYYKIINWYLVYQFFMGVIHVNQPSESNQT